MALASSRREGIAFAPAAFTVAVSVVITSAPKVEKETVRAAFNGTVKKSVAGNFPAGAKSGLFVHG
jgi:hypothetical protein